MATIYTINYADADSDLVNKQPFSISPGEINTHTSLKLPGQGAALYGKHVAESFLHALENFCSATPPVNATKGQLWFDSSTNLMKVLERISVQGIGDDAIRTYKWVPVSRVVVNSTQPSDRDTLWFDTSHADAAQHQLKVFNPGITSATEPDGTWISVADRYVMKAGDTLTGDLTFANLDSGIRGFSGSEESGIVNKFMPSAARGATVFGTHNATVMFATQGAGGHSFVISAGQANSQDADDNENALVRVHDTGVVQIVRGRLDVNSNKITNLTAGTAAADAVNFAQLSSVANAVADLTSNKVARAGDTMTGALTITAEGIGTGEGSAAGEGRFVMVLNGTGADSGGLLIRAQDDNGDESGIEIVNGYGPGGSTQRVFSVKSFNGNTEIAGDIVGGKNLTIAGATNLMGMTTLNSIGTMNVDSTAITNARHLTTKEYVDAKVASVALTGDYTEINPVSPKPGDIRVKGIGATLTIEIFGDGLWNQVFPAMWAN